MLAAVRGLVLVLLVLAPFGPAFAQDKAPDAKGFPARTIHIVVPFPPGGPADMVARVIAQKMSEDWNQTVIVDNKPGANTVLAAQFVARRRPTATRC